MQVSEWTLCLTPKPKLITIEFDLYNSGSRAYFYVRGDMAIVIEKLTSDFVLCSKYYRGKLNFAKM